MSRPETHAFILAAGFGTRMRPLTDHIPKPMVDVAGKPLIDHIIDKMQESGITRVSVNAHHKADVLRAHLHNRTTPQIILSEEEELLDTGGGLKGMLTIFHGRDVLCVNGDAYWTDGPSGNVFKRLWSLWDREAMDMLSLLQPVAGMKLTEGVGDYDLLEDGRVRRSRERKGAHMWTSIRICRADNVP